MKWLAIGVAVVGFGYLAVLAVLSVLSRRAPELGLLAGKLRPCRSRTNCISTEDAARGNPEAPFAFTGDSEAALDRLAAAVTAMPRGRVTLRSPGYLRAEFRTPLLRFVDDLEAAVDPAGGRIQVRSASRVGRGDHGMNRERVRELRRRFGQ